MFWPQQNRLLFRAFDFNAVRFHPRIIFKGLVDDTAIEGVERLQLHHVAPAPNFLGGVFGLFHQGFAGLGAVAADIDRDFRRGLVLLKQKAIDQVLQIGKGLTLAADETAGVFGLDVEQQAVFEMMFFDGGRKTQVLEELFEGGLGLGGHGVWEG